MKFEQRRQAIRQLHLNGQQFYCLIRCHLYQRSDGNLGQEAQQIVIPSATMIMQAGQFLAAIRNSLEYRVNEE